MHCEICGREITRGFLVEIEGAKLIACSRCADRGTIIRRVYADRPEQKKRKARQEEKEKKEYVLVENYGQIIREAREKEGISREDLAKKLHIREGYLHKIEEGELTPTDDVARKLEKILKIKLFREVKEDDGDLPLPEEDNAPTQITLGDVVKIRWVKK
ncbi:MAG: TIGR00270 family protein [Candidatus Diapherotrites archaeon]|nr:TIGR00270 family protein [Candidatus Diapherotrites archaeon]